MTQGKPFTDDEQFSRLAEASLTQIWGDLHTLRSVLRAFHGAERAALMREIKRLRRYERALQIIMAKPTGSDVDLAEAEELVEAQNAVLNSPDAAFIREFTQQSMDAPATRPRALH